MVGSAKYARPTPWLLTNNEKTHLLVKPDFYSEAKRVFASSGMQISLDGFEYVKGAIGTHTFIIQISENKISLWCEELNSLRSIAKSHPHAAYSAFTHRVMSQWTYFFGITDFSAHFLSETLHGRDTTIKIYFLPN